MKIKKLLSKLYVCLGNDELHALYSADKEKALLAEIKKRGYSVEEVVANEKLKQEITSALSRQMLKSKEEREVFGALFLYFQFVPAGSFVCFELTDSFLPKNKIDTYKKLLDSIKERSLTDFSFLSKDGFRQFQLKQYPGTLGTQELLLFIQAKLQHYGNSIGDVNLLFQLQGKPNEEMKIDFTDLHNELVKMKLNFEGQILLTYNENDKAQAMNEVFPKLTTSRRDKN